MSSIRLLVTAEGQTEQKFVRDVLAPHLSLFNVYASARCVLTSKDKKAHREYRGGLLNYEKAKQDILTWMKEDANPDCRFTTMFDLYALPKDFPGYMQASRLDDPYERVRHLEDAFACALWASSSFSVAFNSTMTAFSTKKSTRRVPICFPR